MLKQYHNLGREVVARTEQDREVARILPRCPCAAKDLKCVPFGVNRIAVLAGNYRTILNSRIDLVTLKAMIALCDGTRSVDDISRNMHPYFSTPDQARQNVDEIVILLFQAGLVLDAESLDEAPSPQCAPPFERFWDQSGGKLSRFNSYSQFHRESAAFKVHFEGEERLCEAIQTGFDLAGLARCKASDATLIVWFYQIGARPNWDSADLYPEQLVLFVGVGPNALHIGPLTQRNMAQTVEPWLDTDWVSKATQAVPSPILATIWPSILIAELSKMHCGIDAEQLFHKLAVFGQFEGHDGIEKRIFALSHYDVGRGQRVIPSEAMIVAAGHSSCEMPLERLLNPKIYLSHYSPKNIELAQDKEQKFHGVPVIALPWPETEQRQTLAGQLSFICRFAFGTEERSTRRYTPSGGNLKSAELLVSLPKGAELPEGLYRYRAQDHELEKIAPPLDLGEAGGTAPSFLVVSRYSRVAQKYNEAAFKICNLDCGVALCVLREAASHVGLEMNLRPDLDLVAIEQDLPLPLIDDKYVLTACLTPRAADLVGVKPARNRLEFAQNALRQANLPYWMTKLSKAALADTGSDQHYKPRWSVDGFLAAVTRREAVRDFATSAVTTASFDEAFESAVEGATGFAPFLAEFVTLVGVDAQRERICYVQNGQLIWRNQPKLKRVFCQSLPDEAPAMILAALDLGPLAEAHGVAGYKYALQAVGCALQSAWLSTSLNGLGGTIIGGVLSDGVRACCPPITWQHAPVAGFVFGQERV